MSSINASNLDSGRGSIGGSGGQSGSTPATSDSEAETRTPSKRVKKTSPTLDTIVSFKYSLAQFVTLYATLAMAIDRNEQIVQALRKVLIFAIKKLESSRLSIEDKLTELHNLLGESFPNEEHTPYAKDSTPAQRTNVDARAVSDDFVEKCGWIETRVSDAITSLGKNRVLKLLALQRNLVQAVKRLNETKNLIDQLTIAQPRAGASNETL